MLARIAIERRAAESLLVVTGTREYGGIGGAIAERLTDLLSFAIAAGVSPSGSPRSRIVGMEAASTTNTQPIVRFEVAVPTPTPVSGAADVTSCEHASGEYAVAEYVGANDGLVAAEERLADWIRGQGRRAVMCWPWEVYEPTQPDDSPSTIRVRLLHPLEPLM